MTSVQPGSGESRPGLAIGGGVMAGVLTLALLIGIVTLVSGGDQVGASGDAALPGDLVDLDQLSAGDCVDFATGNRSGIGTSPILADCTDPHAAQITEVIDHPDADGAYPGSTALRDWIGRSCQSTADDFLGTPVLATVLDAGHLLPDADAWAAGSTVGACHVARVDGATLSGSVEDRGDEFPRGDVIPVSRLLAGDCFVPDGTEEAYELNSNSSVRLVACDGLHNGIFFGRDVLDDHPIGAAFPGEEAIGGITSERCAALFESAFGTSAEGFNYRYWRPNAQSWDLGDRNVLCAVLDDEPLDGEFDPTAYERFFDLAAGVCFDLGPEESTDTLRLDDRVQTVDCQRSHVGQMIGSADLEIGATEPFPGSDEVRDLATAQCEQLFTDFVGASPYESELGNFPFWYPNESGWLDGDRRFACAFLDENPRTGSLQGAEGDVEAADA